MAMTGDEMATEMQRRPDAHLLVEWVDELLGFDHAELHLDDMRAAVAAYFEGLEQ